MAISIWAFVSVVVAIPCAGMLGWGLGSFLAHHKWEERWDKWVEDYKEGAQAAFDTIRATSAKDKAEAETIRAQSKIEIEALQAALSEATAEMKEKGMLEYQSEETHESLRERMTIETPDGKKLEPILPGDYI